MVDGHIVSILRSRAEDCRVYNAPDKDVCEELEEVYQVAATNYFSKCRFIYALVTISYEEQASCNVFAFLFCRR